MTRKASNFRLGLFVTIGTLIGVVFIIWVGAANYFEKGVVYATYFDESVQGLQLDSSVKYRGVDTGRVMKIRVAPDNRLVEVVIKIQEHRGKIPEDVVAQLKSAGITGIVFIELDRRAGDEALLGPDMPFKTDHPVIPSRPSEIKQIMAGMSDLYERIQLLDFAGISDRLKGAAESMERFFSNPRLTQILQNIEAATASLDRVTKEAATLMADGRIDQVLVETRESLIEARQLIDTIGEEIRAMKLADMTDTAGRLADNMDRRSRRVAAQAEDLLRSLRRNSEQLDEILERLRNNPSDLIFSDPYPPHGTGRQEDKE
ncbi:MAG: MlaD family protein [Syntrophaceae bacterium]|nr:MlaD family protein [Syntrophaceae bacterium]